FNTTAESISTLKGAFAQAGVSGEEFGGILSGLSEKIASAADSRDELIQGLQGLRGDMLLGKDLDTQLDAIAEKFKTIVAREDQIRVANQLGLGGMIEHLKKGKAGMDALRAAAVANGDVMSGEDAKAASEIMKQYNRTLMAVKSTLISVGKTLLPTGKGFAEFGQDIRDGLGVVREWVAANKATIVIVAGVAAGFVAAGVALGTLSAAVMIAIPIITGLQMAITATGAILAAIASPIGIAAVAVGAIVAAFAYLWSTTEEGKGTLRDIKDAFSDFVDFLGGSWQGVKDALAAGDWGLAFKIGVATADVAWKKFVNGLTIAWVGFKDHFVDTWHEAIRDISKAMVNAAQLLQKVIKPSKSPFSLGFGMSLRKDGKMPE